MRPLHTLALALTLVGCAQNPPPAEPAPSPELPPARRPPTVTPGAPTPHDNVTPGGATPVDPGATPPSTTPATPLSDPTMNDGIGRAQRRLNVRQLRASLLNAVGVTWQQPRRILSADFASGFYDDPNADMLSLLSLTLGQPDYNNFTSESIEPGAVFSKLVGDAARKACRDGVTLDLTRMPTQRILIRGVSETDVLAGHENAVRDNVANLVMRFWAREVAPTSQTVTDLVELFRIASTAPASTTPALAAGTPVDGWRAVCVALVTDPQFLTY
jgi:hypothetical protein